MPCNLAHLGSLIESGSGVEGQCGDSGRGQSLSPVVVFLSLAHPGGIKIVGGAYENQTICPHPLRSLIASQTTHLSPVMLGSASTPVALRAESNVNCFSTHAEARFVFCDATTRLHD